jgi:hypothetical protein
MTAHAPYLSQAPVPATFSSFFRYSNHRLGARPLTVTGRTFTQTDANQCPLVLAAVFAVAAVGAPYCPRPAEPGARPARKSRAPAGSGKAAAVSATSPDWLSA